MVAHERPHSPCLETFQVVDLLVDFEVVQVKYPLHSSSELGQVPVKWILKSKY